MTDCNLVHVTSLARNSRIGERSSTWDTGVIPTVIPSNPMEVRYILPLAAGIEKGTGQDQRIGNKIALRRAMVTLGFFWQPMPTYVSSDIGHANWNTLYAQWMKKIHPCSCRLTVGKPNMTWANGYDPTIAVWNFIESASGFSKSMQSAIHSTGYMYDVIDPAGGHIYQDETFYIRDEGFPPSRDVMAFVRESFDTTCIAGPSITDVYRADTTTIIPQYGEILQGLTVGHMVTRDVEVVFDPPVLVVYDDEGNITSPYSPVVQFLAYHDDIPYEPSLGGLNNAIELGITCTLEWDDGYFASSLRERFRGVGAAAAEALDPDDDGDHDLAASVAVANIPTSKDSDFGGEEEPSVKKLRRAGVPAMSGAEIVRLAVAEVRAEEARQASVNVGPAYDDAIVVSGSRNAKTVREEEDSATFVQYHSDLVRRSKLRKGANVNDYDDSSFKRRK